MTFSSLTAPIIFNSLFEKSDESYNFVNPLFFFKNLHVPLIHLPALLPPLYLMKSLS